MFLCLKAKAPWNGQEDKRQQINRCDVVLQRRVVVVLVGIAKNYPIATIS